MEGEMYRQYFKNGYSGKVAKWELFIRLPDRQEFSMAEFYF
jgi:hypothetical protein